MIRARTVTVVLGLIVTLAGCGAGRQVARDPETEALFRAVREGHADTVRSLLVSSKANVNGTDENGNTPLIEAARLGHDDVVQALLTARADVRAKNNEGKTALMLAVQGGHDEIVRLLKQAGAAE
jgi:uncharacterized protein